MECIYVNICIKRDMYVYLICKEGTTQFVCLFIYCMTLDVQLLPREQVFVRSCFCFNGFHLHLNITNDRSQCFFLGGSLNDPSCFFFLMISDHRSARSKNVYFQQDSYPSTLLYIFLLVFILYIYHVIYIISYLHVTSQMITLVVPFTQSFPQ